MHHIEIESPDPLGHNHRIFLDGKELTGVHSVTATISADEFQQVTLVLEARVNWNTENDDSAYRLPHKIPLDPDFI
jgi:hypothetical protein